MSIKQFGLDSSTLQSLVSPEKVIGWYKSVWKFERVIQSWWRKMVSGGEVQGGKGLERPTQPLPTSFPAVTVSVGTILAKAHPPCSTLHVLESLLLVNAVPHLLIGAWGDRMSSPFTHTLWCCQCYDAVPSKPVKTSWAKLTFIITECEKNISLTVDSNNGHFKNTAHHFITSVTKLKA